MLPPKKYTEFADFAAVYCERQLCEPPELLQKLLILKEKYKPDGLMLLEGIDMTSSHLGQLTILPYGGSATYQEVPTKAISLHGLASTMSAVVGTITAELISEDAKCEKS